jgi:type I restriction enzyme R subunit
VSTYNIVVSTNEATVVTEYLPETNGSADYQSEAALEKDFIDRLCGQGYEYISVPDEAALVSNLRRQLDLLNNFGFSDTEWNRFFAQNIAGANEGIVEKTRRIQEDYVQILKRDDGSTKNIRLIDKANVHNNRLQVINQCTGRPGARTKRGTTLPCW